MNRIFKNIILKNFNKKLSNNIIKFYPSYIFNNIRLKHTNKSISFTLANNYNYSKVLVFNTSGIKPAPIPCKG